MNDKFAFLKSTRFWAIVTGTLAVYLKAKGWIGEAEMVFIASLTAAFTAVRTADRFGEQINTIKSSSTTTKVTPTETGETTTVVTSPITVQQAEELNQK